MIREIFEIKDKSLAGRIGEILTAHGKIRTPTLFPVINPIRQEVSLEVIKNIGFEAIITNAYILKKHMEKEALEKGIHKLMGFEGPIVTDSGGYQILEYGRVDVTPEEIVIFQENIGSDIAVILDVPTGGYAGYEEAKWTVEETIRRAIISLKFMKKDKTLWIFPVQGGKYLDLLEYHARKALELPYDIVSIGSPTQILEKYDYATIIHMIATVKKVLPPSIPVHLFGAGHPMFIPFAVALGVDTFDSASYILYAKDERLIFPHGTMRLKELSEIPCSCPICSKFTPQELMEMNKDERIKCIAIHNLYAIMQEIRRVRQAIKENTLWDLLEERSRCHPSLFKAFKTLIQYKKYLEQHHPISKAEVHGIFLYDILSIHRPEITYYHSRLLDNYKPTLHKGIAIVFLNIEEKPLTRTEFYMNIREALEKNNLKNVHIMVFMPYFGIVPEELCETFPLSQHEKEYDDIVLNYTIDIAEEYFRKNANAYSKILLVVIEKDIKLAESLQKKIRPILGNVEILTYKKTLSEVISEILSHVMGNSTVRSSL